METVRRLTRLVATIRYVPLYECSVCGAEAGGDEVEMNIDVAGYIEGGEELKRALREQVLSPRLMPEGWFMSKLTGKFKCGQCKAKENQK